MGGAGSGRRRSVRIALALAFVAAPATIETAVIPVGGDPGCG